MKSIIRWGITGIVLLMILPALAQDNKKKTEKKQEIVISKSGDKAEKMTIVVDGDNVTINGKPVDEYEKENGADVKIIKRKTLRDGNDEDIDVLVSPPSIAYAPRIPRVPRAPRAIKTPSFRYYNYSGDADEKPRAYLGVLSKDNDKGAEITEVKENTAASKAGLQKGDIITKVGNKEVKDPSSLLEAVKANKPNSETDVTYLRDGKQKKATVKLGETKDMAHSFDIEMPEMPEMNFNFNDEWKDDLREGLGDLREFRSEEGFAPYSFAMGSSRPKLGAKISDLEEGDGVKVLEVEAETAGAKAGLLKDDVITEINGTTIKNTDDAREALRDVKEKSTYNVKVKRGSETKTLEVKIPKKIKTANL